MANIYWIEGPWRGRLAIMARPRGDEWLQRDVDEWRRNRIDVVVSLLTQSEIDELALTQEARVAEIIERSRGCPVPDTSEQKNWVEKFAALTPVPAFG